MRLRQRRRVPRIVEQAALVPTRCRRRGRSGQTTGRPDAMYSNTFNGDQ